jgi:thioredoxin 1
LARIFDAPLTTNDQSIDRVLAAGLPVILVFVDGSSQAGLAETMDRLARENAGKLLVVKVPLKDNPNAQLRFGIVLPPAVASVSNRGQVLSKSEGINPEELAQHTAYLLGQGPKPEGSRHKCTKPSPPSWKASSAFPANSTGDRCSL